MPFGIASAPAIWQRTINTILQDLPGVGAYIDDLIVTGRNRAEHMQNLRRVFQRLSDSGLTTQLIKCLFLQPSVTYTGHRIDKHGIHPTDDKIEAICKRPMPTIKYIKVAI